MLKAFSDQFRIRAERESREDRLTGAFFGLLAGDDFGGPTSMAIALAQSLLKQESFNRNDALKQYIQWWKDDGFDSGLVSQKVFKRIASGSPHTIALNAVDKKLHGKTAGCNPLHRSLPIAMCSFITEFQIESIAIQEALITHKHKDAGVVSAAALRLIRFLIKGQDWNDALSHLENISSVFVSGLIEKAKRGDIIDSGLATDVLTSAIHFVPTSNNFDEMLERAKDFSPASNYCSVLAGSIGGARWGLKAISPYWYKASPKASQIQSISQQFASNWR
jgi:ADP-ribosyl-[dinitrogen reductase] hydrolase